MSEFEQVPAVERESTGHARVDEVLGRLEGLEGLPVSEHVQVFETVLTELRSALAEAGEPTGEPAGEPADVPA